MQLLDLHITSVYLCICDMERGETRRHYDSKTTLMDAVTLAIMGVEFEPMQVDPDADDDELNYFLSGSERSIWLRYCSRD